MPSIHSYQRVTDKYTTYWLLPPDAQDDAPQVVELGDINGRAFVMIPDGVALPPQPKTVAESLKSETMAGWIVSGLLAKSPFLRLTAGRLSGQRRRVLYSAGDEAQLKMLAVFFDKPTLDAHVVKWRKRRVATEPVVTERTL